MAQDRGHGQGLWARLFIGNLPKDYNESDLRDLFKDYSSIRRVDSKREYGYVYFDDLKEADEAMRTLDGKEIDGRRLRIQNVTKREGDKKEPPKYELRIRIHDLAPRTSWQDLKDWARNAGAVQYANVFNIGSSTKGVIEFCDDEGFDNAFKVLEEIPLNRERVRITKESEEARDDGHRREGRPSYRQDSSFDRPNGGGYGGHSSGGYDSYRKRSPGPSDYRGGSRGGRDDDRRAGSDDYRRPTHSSSRRSRSRSRDPPRDPPRSSGYDSRPAFERRDSRGGGYSNGERGGGGYSRDQGGYDNYSGRSDARDTRDTRGGYDGYRGGGYDRR